MSNEQFTAVLVQRGLNWKVCPDRFITSGRSWIPRSRFKPLARLEDAFLLLARVASNYSLTSVSGKFTADVRVGDRRGSASGEPKARTITLAIAQALGIEAPE
jgi:hypothetical protein